MPTAVAPLGLAASFAVIALLLFASRPLRVYFAPGNETVGDTAEFLVATTSEALLDDRATWTREHVREVIHALIKTNLGVTDFDDDSKFVDDMGLD